MQTAFAAPDQLITDPAQFTARAQLITAPAQLPATGAAMYMTLFVIKVLRNKEISFKKYVNILVT